MDYNINIGTSLNPNEKTVTKSDTVRELLIETNTPFQDGQVTLNGRVLGTAELNQTVEELGVKNGDYILATSKHSGGQALNI